MDIIIWVVVVLLVCLVLFGLFVVFMGMRYPVEHTVSRRIQLKQSAEEIWKTITDHEKEPEWQPNLEWVRRLPDVDGQAVWQMKQRGAGNPVMTLRTTVSEPPVRLVGVIADAKKVFDGRWEFQLKPISGATELTLTEVARINNPVFRGLYHLFGDPAMYLDQYLKALGAKYQESVEITSTGRASP